MVFNQFYGDKSICELMSKHPAAEQAYTNTFIKLAKKYGHIYIRLFGYPAVYKSRILARYVLRILSDEPPGNLLDVGCSHGEYSFELARVGFNVIGVDVNNESISLANKIKSRLHMDNVNFYRNDIFNCNFESGAFNVIVILEALEHIRDDDALIKKFNNILKNNGLLIISVPYSENIEEYNTPIGACHTKDNKNIILGDGGGHYRNGYNEHKLTKLLNDNGFNIQEISYTCVPEILPNSVYFFPIIYPVALLLNKISNARENIVVVANKNDHKI